MPTSEHATDRRWCAFNPRLYDPRAAHRGARAESCTVLHTAAMPYDPTLAQRIREIVAGEAGVTEKRMFGGHAFLIGGHMAAAASSQGGLLVRVEPSATASLVSEPHVRRFEMRGRSMDGWLRVAPDAVETDDAMRTWVGRGVAYVRSLPPK